MLSSDNFTEEHLTSGPEFNDVQHRLHASLPDATLIHVTRYVRVVQARQEHVACFSLTRRFMFLPAASTTASNGSDTVSGVTSCGPCEG